jgi:hypothetical protein
MRTASIWRWFMANAEIPHALEKVGLVKQTKTAFATKKHKMLKTGAALFEPFVPLCG